MRHVLLLVILLVVATLLVDLVVVSWVVAAHPVMLPWWWSHPSVVALFALCFAQVGLIGIWTGFGGRSLPWRLLGLALTIGIWARVCAFALAPMPWDRTSVATNWTLLLLGQSVVILVPL